LSGFFLALKKRKLNTSCSASRLLSEKAIYDVFTQGGRKDIESATLTHCCNLWNNKQNCYYSSEKRSLPEVCTDVKVIGFVVVVNSFAEKHKTFAYWRYC